MGKDDVLIELDYYKHWIVRGKKNSRVETDILRMSTPRLVAVNKNTTLKELKEKVLHSLKDLYTPEALESPECPIDLEIRDNLPTVQVGKYGARRSAACEFCKNRHDSM